MLSRSIRVLKQGNGVVARHHMALRGFASTPVNEDEAKKEAKKSTFLTAAAVGRYLVMEALSRR